MPRDGSSEAQRRTARGSLLPEVPDPARDEGREAGDDEERQAGDEGHLPCVRHRHVQDRQGEVTRLTLAAEGGCGIAGSRRGPEDAVRRRPRSLAASFALQCVNLLGRSALSRLRKRIRAPARPQPNGRNDMTRRRIAGAAAVLALCAHCARRRRILAALVRSRDVVERVRGSTPTFTPTPTPTFTPTPTNTPTFTPTPTPTETPLRRRRRRSRRRTRRAVPGPEVAGERWILVDLAAQTTSAMVGEQTVLHGAGDDGEGRLGDAAGRRGAFSTASRTRR